MYERIVKSGENKITVGAGYAVKHKNKIKKGVGFVDNRNIKILISEQKSMDSLSETVPVQRIKDEVFDPMDDSLDGIYENIYHFFTDYQHGYSLMMEEARRENDQNTIGAINRAVEGIERMMAQLHQSYEDKDKKEHGIQIFKGFLAQAIITKKYYEKGKLRGAEENQSGRKPFIGDEPQYVSADIAVSSKPEKKKGYFLQSQNIGEKIVEVKYRPSASYSEEYEDKTLEELQKQVDKDHKVTGRVKIYWYGVMPKKILTWATTVETKSPGITFTRFTLGDNWHT